MKPSGAPEVGDIVQAKEDLRRGIICVGIIIETSGIECYVMWGSRNHRPPKGWWKRTKLVVVNDE